LPALRISGFGFPSGFGLRLSAFFALVALALLFLAPPLSAAPPPGRQFSVADFGARGDGTTLNTVAIQKAIDAAAAAGGGVVTFPQGSYLSGALFVKSGVEFRVDAGVELCAVQDDSQYPERPTRVAGIEMVWPSALLNVYEQQDVQLTGKGVIDGRGDYWWRKFWGADGNGGMLKDYTARGLRWAVDYDCKRVRAVAVYNSTNVAVRDLTIQRSGFWSLTLTYCQDVQVSGVTIRANLGGRGPSSDGIDIDSSRGILVERCDIDCNDDNICLKAGRDADGLRVNRPTENVVIRDCVCRAGHGMLTFGSETSGGIRNIHAYNLKALGTANGIRFKSAKVRGGVVQNICIHDVEMDGVANPFHFELNWYPAYSYPKIPAGLSAADQPAHWGVLARRVEPPGRGIPEFRDIVISNVTARAATQAIFANAFTEKPLRNVRLENVRIEAATPGSIANAADWTMNHCVIATPDGAGLQLKNSPGVPQAETARLPVSRLGAQPPAANRAAGGRDPLGLGLETVPSSNAP
jgi:polygalacturonase